MEWDDLRILLALHRAGSIRGAATQLNVNHSTVSRRLSGMERTLGARLLERRQDGLKATPVGERAIDAALKVEEEILAFERRAASEENEHAGRVTVEVPDMLMTPSLLDAVCLFAKQHPRIDIVLAQTASCMEQTRRDADIAIRMTSEPPEHMVGRKLAVVMHAAYGAPSYVDRMETAQQREEPLFWIEGPQADITQAGMALPFAENMTRLIKIDDMRSFLHALREGHGIGYAPCGLAEPDPTLMRVPDMPVLPASELWALIYPDMRNAARIRLVLDFLVEMFRAQRSLFEGQVQAPAPDTHMREVAAAE